MATALAYNNNLLRMGNMAFAMLTPPSPYFVFEFSEANFVPSTSLLNSNYRSISSWSRVSSSPNRWKLTVNNFVDYYSGATHIGIGLGFLFIDSYDQSGNLTSEYLGGGTCKLIGSGNLNIIDPYGNTCETMDRMFNGCTGLTEFSTLQCTNVVNVGGMFNNCSNVTEGALAQYTWFNTYGINISNHSGTFSNCGSNTQTGTAELAQIPTGWGGTQVPASTLMTSTAGGNTKYTCWTINSNNPTWTDVKNGMYLFTEASVSQYTGVSMNRSRINGKHNSLDTAQATAALYFYPSFIQVTSGKPGATTADLTWLVTTNTPNGNLTVGQGNTDMPGTLDYSTYGAFAREYGTYDSGKDVYFLFLATNVPIANWTGFTDAYGFLYNSYYKTDAGLRWFFET